MDVRVIVCDLAALVGTPTGARLVPSAAAHGWPGGILPAHGWPGGISPARGWPGGISPASGWPGGVAPASGWSDLCAAGGMGVALAAHLAAAAARAGASADTTPGPVPDGPAPALAPTFAVTVGDAVRRGVPTAARASVLARVPSTGRLADGQVGGELGARLAAVCDALLIYGALAGDPEPVAPDAEPTAAVLVVDPSGAWWVERLAGLAGRAPSAKRALLVERFGRCAGLCVGPAGEAGAPLANLASLAEPASYVGRGGLGLAFGATGLAALVVLAPPVSPRRDARAERLRRALERSPRLVARAEGGTLELAEDLAARGAPGAEAAREAARLARESLAGRHGCRGCPTPCGWVLDGGAGTVRGVRFGALAHLTDLARNRPGFDPRALLARCDDLGLDAKGATFAALLLAPLAADAALDLLARGGARAEQLAALFETRAPDQRDDVVARLARRVAGVGRDPMRIGLALADADPERVARSLAPVPWPPPVLWPPRVAEPAATDAALSAGAGRFVWWHECFAAALDAHGFCAFSAAGLVADGLLSIGELAEAVAEPSEVSAGVGAAGAALLALGARLVAARHALAPPAARLARAHASAVDPLEASGALPEYRAAVGLDDRGALELDLGAAPGPLVAAFAAAALRLERRDAAARAAELHTATPSPGALVPAALDATPRRAGSVVLAAGPTLAARLGGELHLALDAPSTVRAVLAVAERLQPPCEGWLLRGRELLPAVHRAGVRLGPDEVVQPGDRLDLVLVIAGG